MIAYLTVHRAVQKRGKTRVYPEETVIEKGRERTEITPCTHLMSTPGEFRGRPVFIISLPLLRKED